MRSERGCVTKRGASPTNSSVGRRGMKIPMGRSIINETHDMVRRLDVWGVPHVNIGMMGNTASYKSDLTPNDRSKERSQGRTCTHTAPIRF